MNLKKICAKIRERFVRTCGELRTRLFVTYFVLIILVVVGIGTASSYFAGNSVETKLMDANEEITNQIHKNLESDFQQVKTIMLLPYNNGSMITDINHYKEMSALERAVFQRDVSDYFMRSFYVMQKSDLENFYIYAKDGTLLYTSNFSASAEAESDFSNGTWSKRTTEKDGDIYFSGIHTHADNQAPYFSASIMIKDISDSRYCSFVKADFNFSEITSICNNSFLGKNSETTILDEDGKTVYSTDSSKIGKSLDPEITPKMTDSSGAFWAQTANGRFMVSYRKSEISGWNIVSMISEDSILDATKNIEKMTVIVSVIALIITMFISALFASSMSKPLLKLNRMVDCVREGNLDIHLEGKGSCEMQGIYHAFNILIDEVNDLIRTKYVYQIRQKEYELNLLYAQINPHFLYNTLDTIQVMADCGEMKNVSKMITLLSDMLHYSVKNISAPVFVEQELEHIEDYLTICSIRFENKVRYRITADPEVRNRRIPRLILQPVVENSLRHGMPAGKIETILVSAKYLDHMLVFTVEDDGRGIPEETLQNLRRSLEGDDLVPGLKRNTKSIGLENINNRLKLFYGDAVFIRVESVQNQYTKIQITVPPDLPGTAEFGHGGKRKEETK